MVAFDVDRQIAQCRNLERLMDVKRGEVDEAHRLVEEASLRLQDLAADLSALDPADLLSRRALEQAISASQGTLARLEGQLERAQDEFRALTNQFDLDQCNLFL